MKKDIKLWIFCVLMTFLMVGSWCFGSTARASVQQDFINQLSPDVVNVAHKYNLYPSVMMAQAALESGFGQSALSQEANNYFGVKGSYNGQYVTMPTLEYNQQGQPYYIDSDFRKYPNPEASLEDNAQLIRNGVYGDPTIYSGAWRENANDSISAANALGSRYATDPNYATDLVSLIQQYNLNTLLDNTWKRLHIVKLKKKVTAYFNKIKHFKKQYSQYVNGLRRHSNNVKKVAENKQKIASSHSQLVKYARLYRNDQVTLSKNYREYSIYDHLNRMDLDNWERLSASANRPVYTDMMGVKNGHHYYRIRFSRSRKDMYWVRADALSFVKPIYYHHLYQIAAHEMDLHRAYNAILGTSNMIKRIPSRFSKPVYSSNLFAIVPNNYTGHVWYHIKNDTGRPVWLAGNPEHGTQYLNYHETKELNPNYTQAKLSNHAADADYHDRYYSWSRVKPQNNQVNVDRLAINTRNNDSFWYRINNQHHTYWTNLAAFQ